MIKAYVDGAASRNGCKDCIAGWAFVLLDDNDNIIKEASGSIPQGTNNIGELTAIKEAIIAYKQIETNQPIIIFSDSAYCINGITNWRYKWKQNNWWRDSKKTQPVKNRDLWIELDKIIDSMYMTFEKVAGHSTLNNSHAKWNNYVDKLAVKETKS